MIDGSEYKLDDVFIHPTVQSKDEISGTLAIVIQGGKAHLRWKPHDNDPLKMRYAVDVVLKEIKSIMKQIPSMGFPRITLVLLNGVTLPPLYFHQGGLPSFIIALEEHVKLTKWDKERDTFLVGEKSDRLHHTLDELQSSQRNSGFRFDIFETLANVTQFARNIGGNLSAPTSRPNAELLDESTLGGIPPVYAGPQSSILDWRQQTMTDVGAFEVLSSDTVEPVPELSRSAPLDADLIRSFMDDEGRIECVTALLHHIYTGGIEPSCRSQIWPMLLNYLPFEGTHSERAQIRKDKAVEYYAMKSQWQSITPRQEARFAKFRDVRHRIEKDVRRTDRSLPFFDGPDDSPNLKLLHEMLLTYGFFNNDLGYVQGMNDLLAVIFVVMRDEADSFWCFSGCMDMMLGNFEMDQLGIQRQLEELGQLCKFLDPRLYAYLDAHESSNFYFCFRWLLVNFKREFDYDDIMKLWEILWTRYRSEHFQLFICLAIISKYRLKIMQENMQFEDILKFTNDLADNIDLDETLQDAEKLYQRLAKGCPAHLWHLLEPNNSPVDDASVHRLSELSDSQRFLAEIGNAVDEDDEEDFEEIVHTPSTSRH